MRRLSLLLVLLVLLFASVSYVAWLALGVRTDVQDLTKTIDPPEDMTYVEFTKDGVTHIYVMPDGVEGVHDLAAALLAADGSTNKEATWHIQSGAEVHLVVPPKANETPQGTEHCERFERVKNGLQSTPGLQPVE